MLGDGHHDLRRRIGRLGKPHKSCRHRVHDFPCFPLEPEQDGPQFQANRWPFDLAEDASHVLQMDKDW